MPGKVGLDLRLLASEAVVTRVEPGSPAERAGLHPGFIVATIDGNSVEQIIAAAAGELAPPYTDSGRIDQLTRAVLGRIYGAADTCVTIGWLDGDHDPHERCIERVQRKRPAAMESLPLPPAHLEVLAAQFMAGETRLGTLRTRERTIEWEIQAADNSYEGPLLILIDRLSFSASEWFAYSMQALARAVVVGVRSPGGVTGAGIAQLPNDALLIYTPSSN